MSQVQMLGEPSGACQAFFHFLRTDPRDDVLPEALVEPLAGGDRAALQPHHFSPAARWASTTWRFNSMPSPGLSGSV